MTLQIVESRLVVESEFSILEHATVTNFEPVEWDGGQFLKNQDWRPCAVLRLRGNKPWHRC
jgi:hypothetical protein